MKDTKADAASTPAASTIQNLDNRNKWNELSIMMATKFCVTFLLFLCVSVCQSFTPPKPSNVSSGPAIASKTAVNYQNEAEITLERPLRTNKIPRPSKRTKFFVEEIASLDELKYFLEQDERPVVVK